MSSSIDWPRITPSCAATSLPLGTGCPLQLPRRGGSTHQAPSGCESSPNSNEAACKEERAGGAPSFASRMAPPDPFTTNHPNHEFLCALSQVSPRRTLQAAAPQPLSVPITLGQAPYGFAPDASYQVSVEPSACSTSVTSKTTSGFTVTLTQPSGGYCARGLK